MAKSKKPVKRRRPVKAPVIDLKAEEVKPDNTGDTPAPSQASNTGDTASPASKSVSGANTTGAGAPSKTVSSSSTTTAQEPAKTAPSDADAQDAGAQDAARDPVKEPDGQKSGPAAAKMASSDEASSSPKPSKPVRDQKDPAKSPPGKTGETVAGAVAKPKGFFRRAASFLLIVGIAAAGGAWLFREYGTAYFPADQLTAQIGQINAQSSANAVLAQKNQDDLTGFRAQVDALDSATGAINSSVSELSSKVSQVQDALAALQDRPAATPGPAPSQDTLDAAAALAEIQQKIDGFGSRLEKVEETISEAAKNIANLQLAARDADAAAGQSSAALTANGDRIATLDSQLTSLSSRLDAAQAALNSSSQLESSVAALEQEVAAKLATAQRQTDDRIAGVTDILIGLRSELEEVKAAPASPAAELATALADLRDRIAAGQPYLGQFKQFSSLMPGAPALDVLSAHAAQGAATPVLLATTLSGLKGAFEIKTNGAAAAADTGVFDSLTAKFSSVVQIKRKDAADWPAAIEKAAAAARAGDLSQAISIIEDEASVVPDDLSAWLIQARASQDVNKALAQVSQAVVARIGSDN